MVTMSILQNKRACLFTFLARREIHRFSGRKCSMPHYLIIFKLFFPTYNGERRCLTRVRHDRIMFCQCPDTK